MGLFWCGLVWFGDWTDLNFMYRVILVPKSIYLFSIEFVCTDLVFCFTAFVCNEFDLPHDDKLLDPNCMRKPGQYCRGPSFHGSK